MVKIKIVTTCLYNGFSNILDAEYKTQEEAKKALDVYLSSLNAELPKKFRSAQKRVAKGTSKGVKIFYSPEVRVRHYLWITITQDIQL